MHLLSHVKWVDGVQPGEWRALTSRCVYHEAATTLTPARPAHHCPLGAWWPVPRPRGDTPGRKQPEPSEIGRA